MNKRFSFCFNYSHTHEHTHEQTHSHAHTQSGSTLRRPVAVMDEAKIASTYAHTHTVAHTHSSTHMRQVGGHNLGFIRL